MDGNELSHSPSRLSDLPNSFLTVSSSASYMKGLEMLGEISAKESWFSSFHLYKLQYV